MDIQLKIIIFLLLAVILTRLPILGKYFAIIHTLIHEVGHQIGNMITFGKPHKIALFANTEGIASSYHRFWIGKVITAFFGYFFASFISFVFFYLIYKNRLDLVIWILVGFLIVSLLFWVRNLYGLFWILTFGSAFSWLLFNANYIVKENIVLLLVSIVLIESITSAFEIMYLSFKTPRTAGDATSLSKLTFLPSQIWGILFFVQSFYFGWLCLGLFFPF